LVGEWSIHGGRLSAARAAYAHAPTPWLDLSTGINPEAWDVEQAGRIDWRALPDEPALAALEMAAAEHFGVAADRVCAVPGTEIGLRLLETMNLPAPHFHVEPGYRTHGEAFGGSRPIEPDTLSAARGGTILLANPNNPDGRTVPPSMLMELARGGWLVVDEAFADACPEASVLPCLDGSEPIIVLRSFGKFFGLAGLRLGFVIAPASRISLLRKRLGSWPLSTAAIAIGTAAYRDRDWIVAARARLADEARALDAILARHGLEPIGDCPLFRLVVSKDANTIFERLARQGILTRPFDYEPNWLRFGLPGDEAALARLDRSLANG
jgi:cobalamin biosynthetic protein CobC